MYEFLKTIMEAVEKIGSVNEVSLKEKTSYCGNRIEISGVSSSGEAFELRLEVGDPSKES